MKKQKWIFPLILAGAGLCIAAIGLLGRMLWEEPRPLEQVEIRWPAVSTGSPLFDHSPETNQGEGDWLRVGLPEGWHATETQDAFGKSLVLAPEEEPELDLRLWERYEGIGQVDDYQAREIKTKMGGWALEEIRSEEAYGGERVFLKITWHCKNPDQIERYSLYGVFQSREQYQRWKKDIEVIRDNVQTSTGPGSNPEKDKPVPVPELTGPRTQAVLEQYHPQEHRMTVSCVLPEGWVLEEGEGNYYGKSAIITGDDLGPNSTMSLAYKEDWIMEDSWGYQLDEMEISGESAWRWVSASPGAPIVEIMLRWTREDGVYVLGASCPRRRWEMVQEKFYAFADTLVFEGEGS